MLSLLARRLAMSLLVLVIVPSLTFLFEALSPGNIAETLLGQNATAAQIRQLSRSFGLNRPLLWQYGHWLSGVLHGDLGTSYTTGQPVASMLSTRLPVTLSLAAGSMLVAIVIGLGLGLLSAVSGPRLRRLVDVLSVAGLAIPAFWLGINLVVLFAVKIPAFPATGYVPFASSPLQWLRSLVLPCLAIGVGLATLIAKQTRDQILTALDQDYVRSLRANGASESSVLLRHALRNASIPLITVVGVSFVGALTATVFLESVFVLPGLGSALSLAAQEHDLPTVEGISLYFTVMVVATNLIVDLAYGWLDPRAR